MNNIPITKPYLGEEEKIAVQEVLDSGWLVQGKQVEKFEKMIAEHEHVNYCCATTSCTTALQLTMIAMGMTNEMDVIVPSFTFVATANAVVSTGATPILVDVNEQTYNLDERKLEQYIIDNYFEENGRWKNKLSKNILWGMVPVHQFGLCADMKQINVIAKKYNMKIIEDGACALGSKIGDTHIGGFGNPVCISFHPRKSITTGEGGMILTNDEVLYNKVLALRNHGSFVAADKRHEGNGFLLPEYIYSGFNYRMTDIQGAIGCVQVKKLDFILKRRHEIANVYNELIIRSCKNIELPYVPDEYYHSYQSYVCKLKFEGDLSEGEQKRNYIMRELSKYGIITRQGTHAVHKLDYYKKRFGLQEHSLPNANKCDIFTISLPVFITITREEQEYVIKLLKNLSEE